MAEFWTFSWLDLSNVDEPQSEIRVGAETDVTVDPALEATVITTPKNDHKNRHQGTIL
jgi:hypothetical protein